jgi:hypothetical protein
MTQEEIIEMATQVYGECEWHESALFHLHSFAKLVAAKKQEDIIQIIKETPFSNWFQADVIEAIRARGEQA